MFGHEHNNWIATIIVSHKWSKTKSVKIFNLEFFVNVVFNTCGVIFIGLSIPTTHKHCELWFKFKSTYGIIHFEQSQFRLVMTTLVVISRQKYESTIYQFGIDCRKKCDVIDVNLFNITFFLWSQRIMPLNFMWFAKNHKKSRCVLFHSWSYTLNIFALFHITNLKSFYIW
jgi:hypothetical protein